MKNLSAKIAEYESDGLIADLDPKALVAAGTIRKLSTAATLKRGTILAKSSGAAGDGKLVILGTTAASNETLTPDCILCDDVDVGTTEDMSTPVYISGCFNLGKVTVNAAYTITEDNKDKLRERGIIFKAVSAAL